MAICSGIFNFSLYYLPFPNQNQKLTFRNKFFFFFLLKIVVLNSLNKKQNKKKIYK